MKDIEKKIILLRAQRVILDTDLAALHGISTKRLNEKLKRNADSFEKGDIIRLIKKEKENVVANCDHLLDLKYSPHLPRAFTEKGEKKKRYYEKALGIAEGGQGDNPPKITDESLQYGNSSERTNSEKKEINNEDY